MGAWLDPSLCPEEQAVWHFSRKSPRGKFGKVATDLPLVFRGLQEQCVNQSDGVGLDLLVRAVSTETERQGSQGTAEQEDDAHRQLKTLADCNQTMTWS